MARSALSRAKPFSGETRQRLIDAARALMAERSSLDVPIIDITKRADSNVALVSYYFKGREGLLVAIAKADAEYALTQLARLLATDFSPTEKLRRHILGLVQVYGARPYLSRLLHTIMREGSHEAAEAVAEFFVKPLAIARRTIFQDGIKTGEFREVEPDLIGFAIDGACEHIFASREARKAVFGHDDMNAEMRDRHAAAMADLFVQGLRRQPVSDK